MGGVGGSDPECDSGPRGAQAGRCEHLAWGRGAWYPFGRAGGFTCLELGPEEPPGRGVRLKWGYPVWGWGPNVWWWDNVVWAGQSQRWWVLTVRGSSILGDVRASWCGWDRTGGVTHTAQ